MKEFIVRNKQIFITGAVIAGIFLLIILTSSARKVKGPILAPSESSTGKEVLTNPGVNTGSNYTPNGLWNAPSLSDEPVDKNTPETPEEEPVEKPKEILKITFDDLGFSPSSTNGLKYQTVRWTNRTDKSIYLQQMKDFFEEFRKPVEIASGGTLEFELNRTGMWGYKETDSGKMGSIFILLEKPEN